MGSLGFPRYLPLGWMNWAPVLGLRQEQSLFTRPAYKYFFNPAPWTWGVGLRVYFLNPITNENLIELTNCATKGYQEIIKF